MEVAVEDVGVLGWERRQGWRPRTIALVVELNQRDRNVEGLIHGPIVASVEDAFVLSSVEDIETTEVTSTTGTTYKIEHLQHKLNAHITRYTRRFTNTTSPWTSRAWARSSSASP